MPKSKNRATRNTDGIFQLKIKLNDSSPLIWRRILVPKNYSFFDLHVAIQNSMGWTDSHLHAFYIEKRKGVERIAIEFPNLEGEDLYRGETRDERRESIADYFDNIIKQCTYSYDFGDNWDHTILFERELPVEAQTQYPQCITGAGACPPEDCGGVWGYADLQRVLKNSKNPEHKDTLEWLALDDPSQFNPLAFNPEEVEFDDPKQRLRAQVFRAMTGMLK